MLLFHHPKRYWVITLCLNFSTGNQIFQILYRSRECLKRIARRQFRKLRLWLLDVEMGFVWGMACISMIVFVLASVWYIDPALLTLVLRFKRANCTTRKADFLIGISNCPWTSCKIGCTRDFYQCWKIVVDFEYEEGSEAYTPPWDTLANLEESNSQSGNLTKLYPNVRGCGYPPELNCKIFFETFGNESQQFKCWVSTTDNSIAITEFDLVKMKKYL